MKKHSILQVVRKKWIAYVIDFNTHGKIKFWQAIVGDSKETLLYHFENKG